MKTKQEIEKQNIDTQGLELIAQGDRFEIWDDQKRNRAIIIVGQGPGTNPSAFKTIEISRPERKLKWKLVEYVVSSLIGISNTIPFILKNKSLMKMAHHFYSYKSRSEQSLKIYSYSIKRFCDYVGKSPDELVDYCFIDGIQDPKRTKRVIKLVREYMEELEANDLAFGTLNVELARIKTFFEINDVEIKLPNRYSFRPKYRLRAPTPEEVQKLIEVADLREKAMIAMLATGGFRIGTLISLKYRHVKKDLEAGITPLHIHVEADLTKGKYADYDTFINGEAVRYLKLYLEQRRKGTKKIPPEEIEDESPLFRTRQRVVKPLSYKGASEAFNKVRRRALLDSKSGRFHEIRIHGLRKFFRTQLTALGAPVDYIEYMMGHKLSTYHDVQMKGVEFLRQVYASAGLRIFQKPKTPTLADILKEMIRAKGEDPTKYLKEEIINKKVILTEEQETELYSRVIWELLQGEHNEASLQETFIKANDA